MKTSILVSLLLVSIVSCTEFRLFTFPNIGCDEDPIVIVSSTDCSPDSFYKFDNNFNATKVILSVAATTKEECVDNFDHSEVDNFQIDTCLIEEDEYSIVATYKEDSMPTLFKDYCNQVNLYDCNNYNVYSFRNDSCFSSGNGSKFPYYRQLCIGDSIYSYKCTDQCTDENCVIDKIENSNTKSCQFKTISLDDIEIEIN